MKEYIMSFFNAPVTNKIPTCISVSYTHLDVYKRQVWYILLTDTGSRHYGVGECAPLPALSCDDIPSYDEVLATACLLYTSRCV